MWSTYTKCWKHNSTCFTNKFGTIMYTIFWNLRLIMGLQICGQWIFRSSIFLLERNLRPSNKKHRFYFPIWVIIWSYRLPFLIIYNNLFAGSTNKIVSNRFIVKILIISFTSKSIHWILIAFVDMWLKRCLRDECYRPNTNATF